MGTTSDSTTTPRTDPAAHTPVRDRRGPPGSRAPSRDEEQRVATVRELFDTSFVLVGIFTVDGRLVEANHAAYAAAGVRPEEVIDKPLADIGAFAHSPLVIAQMRSLFERALGGEATRAELPVRLRGARIAQVDCMVSPLRDSTGRITQIAVTAVEITAQRSAEASLLRVNRELRMLGSCHQVLLRARTEHVLLHNLCRIIVDIGGYAFVWVGYPEDDAERTVRPVGHAGGSADYLQAARVSWGNSQRSQGPTGRAIRLRSIQICRETDSDPAFAPWRTDARKRGYLSSIALPILAAGDCIGALNIYSRQPDRFDSHEVALLASLAGDLGYGIAALRAQSESRLFRSLLDRANDLIYTVDAESGRILDANATVSQRLGYAREELLQMSVMDFSITTPHRSWAERIDCVRAVGSMVSDAAHRTKRGELIAVEASLRYVEEDHRPYVICVTRDISDRRHQEERIAALTRTLRLQSGINAAVLRIRERDELLREACRLATSVGGYERAVLSIVAADGRRAIPQFRAGAGADFPEPAFLPISDGTEPDSTLSGLALRTGEIAVCSDLTRSHPPVAMRERLIELGYRSIVALPLIVDGQRVGVLTLTSRDANLVQDEELLLLEDVVASLSFALRSQQHADAVQFLASFDPLTGLAKRQLFCERLQPMLRRRPGSQEGPAVIVFDIESLGRLNDSFGRRFGDLALQKVAERLKREVNGDEHIGYLGGGVFAFVTAQSMGADAGRPPLLEACVFAEPFCIEGRTIRLSYRSGAARSPEDGAGADTVVQRAEAALKQAKESGEQHLQYHLTMHSEISARLQLEHKLRSALDEHQFELYYQPQRNLANERIEAVEALLRWNDPESGLVTPARFLPVLESSGMIAAVGSWVLEQALAQCERWSQHGLGPLRVAVNLSALQLRRKTFVPGLLKLHERIAGLRGFGLDLEITETMLLEDLDGASRKLRELRAAGIRIALDDFGTGYSSLGLLSKLPVDLLKIDGSFVAGLPHDPTCVLLVETIVRLASSFGLVTVAEGVETVDQLEALRHMGCNLSQGFLHSPPVPLAQLEAILSR
ncbi:MAG TPA: EAL domain-containing protein [Steroidobacteraceae bacterium]|nr:EAL domain-containing protein [Steroidobacteraceae bacterium]